MPSDMIRRTAEGQLTFNIAKKDQAEIVVSLEHASPDAWGGEVVLGDGSSYWIEPMPQPKLPITVRAKRAGEA